MSNQLQSKGLWSLPESGEVIGLEGKAQLGLESAARKVNADNHGGSNISGWSIQQRSIFVYYPLLLVGILACTLVATGDLKLRRHYRELELRKMRAMDAQ